MPEDFTQERFGALVFRLAEKRVRRRLFKDFPVGHEQYTVRNLARKTHLVGNADHRHSVLRKFDHCVEDLLYHFRVKGRCRLIKEHDLWFHAQGTGNGDALLLAAGKLGWIFFGLFEYVNSVEILSRNFLRVHPRHFFDAAQCQRTIVNNGQVWKQIEALEYHADVATNRLDGSGRIVYDAAVNDDRAALCLLKVIDAADQRRLA